jgi:nicotinamidase-related amidase
MKRSRLGSHPGFRRAVLVVLDLQNDFCAPGGLAARYAEAPECLERAVTSSELLIAHARSIGTPRIFVRSVMDNKYKLPKLLDRHRRLGLKEQICREGTWGAEFYRIAPRENECVVTKHTNDAFLYTFLEPLLRKHRAQTIILCGLYTELCMEDTVRSALQRGFHVIVPPECTAGLSLVCTQASLDNMAAFQVDLVSLRDLLPTPPTPPTPMKAPPAATGPQPAEPEVPEVPILDN